MDPSKVIVDPNPKKDRGLKPITGMVDKAIYGLEFRQRMIEFEKKKIQQLIFKANRLGQSGNLDEMTKVTEEIERRGKELTRLEKDFQDRCVELKLVAPEPSK